MRDGSAVRAASMFVPPARRAVALARYFVAAPPVAVTRPLLPVCNGTSVRIVRGLGPDRRVHGDVVQKHEPGADIGPLVEQDCEAADRRVREIDANRCGGDLDVGFRM